MSIASECDPQGTRMYQVGRLFKTHIVDASYLALYAARCERLDALKTLPDTPRALPLENGSAAAVDEAPPPKDQEAAPPASVSSPPNKGAVEALLASVEEALGVEQLEKWPEANWLRGLLGFQSLPRDLRSTRVVFASPGYESKRPPSRYSEQYFGHNCVQDCNFVQRALQIVLFSLLEAPK